MQNLPNLEWLRFFAAAAATESFTLAGEQLGVTAAAVSQRVKSLEAALGVILFHRHPRCVRLTAAGRRYADQLVAPFDALQVATREIVDPQAGGTARMSVLPAFGQLWLGPRIQDFHRAYPGMSMEVWADPVRVDLKASGFDLAIRYGNPPFAGSDHRPLQHDALVPVASPAVANAPRDAGGVFPVGEPMIVDTYWREDLETWLRGTGHAPPVGLKVQHISLYSMVVETVLAGRGFMIGHTALVSDLLADGRLRRLDPRLVAATSQFHVLTRRGISLSPAAARCLEWLLGKADESDRRNSGAVVPMG